MAFAEKRGNWYRLVFRHNGKRFTHKLKTKCKEDAEAVAGAANRTLMLLEQRVLQLPHSGDLVSFVLSGGQQSQPELPQVEPPKIEEKPTVTLATLKKRYIDTVSIGAVEENSLDTIKMHLRHITRFFTDKCVLDTLSLGDLQDYINRRTKAKGIRGRKLSPTTICKELASFRAAWNWAVQAGLFHRAFPNKGLKYPKMNEKPPFQTWLEIERQVPHVPEGERQDLWDCLFLTMPELNDLLTFLQSTAAQPFLYPMCCFTAHTGARRSEMLRLKITDVDLDAGAARIHEKKRVHGKRTTRRVPLCSRLIAVLRDWLAAHPGGPHLFAQPAVVRFSKKKRPCPTAITQDEAHDHLKRALAETKWKVVRGWHLFRHTFISLCVARGIDQRLIDSWVGHTTEDMRKRYTHLYPSAEREAIQAVFATL